MSIENQLPSLEGSEKQVRWAEDIRENIQQTVKDLENYIKAVNLDLDDVPDDFFETTIKKEHILSEFLRGTNENHYEGDFLRKEYRKNIEKFKEGMDRDKYEARREIWVINVLIRETKKLVQTEKTAKWYIEHKLGRLF